MLSSNIFFINNVYSYDKNAYGSVLKGASFWNTYSSKYGANTNLAGADLSNKNLTGYSFKNINLRNAKFNNSNLKDVNFYGADLGAATFKNANLEGADFRNAKFGYGTRFDGANLKKANFTDLKHFIAIVG